MHYEFSFASSLAKVSRDGCRIFMCYKKSDQVDLLCLIILFVSATRTNETKC